MSSRLACAALACGLLWLGASPGAAQPAVQQILVLQSFARGNLTLDHFTGNFRVDLDQIAGRPVNVVQLVVGPTGFVGAAEQAVVDYIRSTFAGQPRPDLIVTVGGPAAVFGRKYRQQLFPEAPILFASVDERYLRSAPLGENETAVAVINDFPRLVDDILHVLPETRHVFMVLGSGSLGKFWRPELEREFQRFRGRLTFIWSDELSLAEIVRRCANLPAHAAIFYLSFNSDSQGGAYADERVMADLRATANAPLFAGINVFLGSGVVGGTMMSIDALSRSSAEVAVRLLNGESPSRVRVPPQPTGPPIFDWRELQRWGIGESRLPAGSVVRYRAPSPWQQYRFTVLGVLAALVVQSLLIGGLLFERRARQRAEIESRKNLALAADASRRQTMSALTSSIGHELGQPLTAILHNVEALQILVSANRATSDDMGEIVADIQAEIVQATQIIDRHRTMLRSHQLEKKPVDLHAVIKASLALVAHDMRARHIEATAHMSSDPCVIVGDPVLLQQVLVNLVVNAMDAMAETPPARRRLTIRSEVRAADVEVSVRDTGTGLPTHINGKLFAPFVTTKTHGLGIGLTIVRTIVDAHGGTIEAHNNPDGGATFAVTFRCNGTSG
ncbi:Sensor protein FixL [Luteitalea pratensis]|uniref:histidine kinase n=1 Tax=Luteitalea pratensis TaxID=1855912 RepID=A0A143PI71_LUTPR|nr:HAMP domain-containing sensor histidine kinase [Luteitalea pratensis]AMY08191.1 Sensor protein FixL [Luteitalea pratensis]